MGNSQCATTGLVSGGAQGASFLAEVIAAKYGLSILMLKPDWKQFRPSADITRNIKLNYYFICNDRWAREVTPFSTRLKSTTVKLCPTGRSSCKKTPIVPISSSRSTRIFLFLGSRTSDGKCSQFRLIWSATEDSPTTCAYQGYCLIGLLLLINIICSIVLIGVISKPTFS